MDKVNYKDLKEDNKYILVILVYESDREEVRLYGRFNKEEIYKFLEDRYEDYFEEDEVEYYKKEYNIKLEDDVIEYVNKVVYGERVEIWEG